MTFLGKKYLIKILSIHIFILFSVNVLFAQYNKNFSLSKAIALQKKAEQTQQKLIAKLAQQKGWDLYKKAANSNHILAQLTDIDIFGMPLYTSVSSNLLSASTVGTNNLWNNNALGISINGSSVNLTNKIALWDGGKVLADHIEFAGRIIQKDNTSSVSNHSTHVAGTILALGVNAKAKGMAFGLPNLICYDYTNHLSEMMEASPNLLLSNHSYGNIAGWNLNGQTWEFYGLPNATEDYKFGYYDNTASKFDSIAYNNPYYLILKSAGNNRVSTGPLVGQPYSRFDDNGKMSAAGNRPSGISSNDGYGTIATYGNAKNIMSVGGIYAIPNGYSQPSDVKITPESSWGPTDDGRIKPDIVAVGNNVLSTTSASNWSYEALSGTSMAAPNATGSLVLLQELYSKYNAGKFLKASTLKALVINTTNEAGEANGPDFKFGFGLLNTYKAAETIKKDSGNTRVIVEDSLLNGNSFTKTYYADNSGRITVTLAWQDVAATPFITNVLNNTSPRLINDLDIRIVNKNTNATYLPWKLNAQQPEQPATTGDNTLDNVEKIDIYNATAGDAYVITVTHKNTLQNNVQLFSIVTDGLTTHKYCTYSNTNSVGAKLSSLSFANIEKNYTTCNTYNNLLATDTAKLVVGKTYTLLAGTSHCSTLGNNFAAKLYIDFNNNAVFEEPAELVAQTSVLPANANIMANISVANLTKVGTKSVMRLVLQETENAASINACNINNKGQVYDFAVSFVAANKDVSVENISVPTNALNADFTNKQYITTTLANKGLQATTAPINVELKLYQNNQLIQTIQDVYSEIILANNKVNFTLKDAVQLNANAAYTATINISMLADENGSNNYLSQALVAKADSLVNNESFKVANCNNSSMLKVTNAANNKMYYWFTDSANTANPIAQGTSVSLTTNNAKYFVSTGGVFNVGAKNKNISATGAYQAKGGNYMLYSSTVPLILQSAKLYTSYPGKINISVINIVSVDTVLGAYSYKVLDNVDINALASRPTKATGAVSVNDAQDTGRIYNLNLMLPAGNYAIVAVTDSVANIYRSNGIVTNSYPYEIPGVFKITGNSVINTSSSSDYKKFYYYFYDMQIKTIGWPSVKMPAVLVSSNAPQIKIVGDSLVCLTTAPSYQWYKNNNLIIGQNNRSILFTDSANYYAKITDDIGCTQISNIVLTPKPTVVASLTLEVSKVYPNPVKNNLYFEIKNLNNQSVQIQMLDVAGRKMIDKNLGKLLGNYTNNLSVIGLKNGWYFLRVLIDGKQYVQKVFVHQ